MAWFVIVAASFGGHCVTVGVCHCLSKSDMFRMSMSVLKYVDM